MKLKNSIILTLTALIWGTAFVAQSTGGDAVGPYSFNCIRNIIGGTVLIPVIMLLDRLGFTKRVPKTKEDKKRLLTGGIICGIILFVASSLQQLGIYLGAEVGKAGFLTACYILIVPLLGLFIGKKCGFNIWIGVALTLAGLYLLCIQEDFSIQFSDILLLGCALMFSFHILVIDHFSPLVEGVRMSCIQFFTCGIIGLIPTIFGEMGLSSDSISTWLGKLQTLDAWIPILYAAVMSSGVAYTLQIIGQEGANPTIASLLMSLESVFSVLAGWILLGQTLDLPSIIGCVLIFIAIVIAQLPVKSKT